MALASLLTEPASTSSWVSVQLAFTVADWPGFREASGAPSASGVTLDRPSLGSLICGFSSVTVPVLVSVSVYSTVSPALLRVPLGAPFLLSVKAGSPAICWLAEALFAAGAVWAGAGTTVALAWLFTTPASTSAWVRRCSRVMLAEAPGARPAAASSALSSGSLTSFRSGSVTSTWCRVTGPELVTVMVKGTTSPAAFTDRPSATVLVTVKSGAASMGSLTWGEESCPGSSPRTGAAVACAVLSSSLPSISAWVTVRVKSTSLLSPGARVPSDALAGVAPGSVATASFSVTLPVFFTVTVYSCVSPSLPSALPLDTLLTVKAGAAGKPTRTSPETASGTSAPLAEVAFAVATLTKSPRSMSAWVRTYSTVPVVLWPGFSSVLARVTLSTPAAASLALMPRSVVSPLLVSVSA